MTSCMNKVSADLLRILNTAFAGDLVRAVEHMPATLRPAPLKKSTIALGLCDAEVLPCAMADFAGLNEGGESIYGRTLELTVSMLIYSPPNSTSAECQRIFGVICDRLLFAQTEYLTSRIWCEKVRYEKEIGALVLPCFARLKIMVTQTQNENGITNFIIRRVNT